MEYDNLIFTDAEKERLKENRNAVNAWIMENVVPHLAKEERIIIDYGDSYKAPGSFSEPTTEYHFAVYGEEHQFYSGGGRQSKGYIGIGQRYGGISHAMQTVGNAYDLYPIFANWTLIKNRLLREVEDRKTKRMEIYSFTV